MSSYYNTVLLISNIFQAKVDKGVHFVEVMRLFDEWLEAQELGSKYRFALATDWYSIMYNRIMLVGTVAS